MRQGSRGHPSPRPPRLDSHAGTSLSTHAGSSRSPGDSRRDSPTSWWPGPALGSQASRTTPQDARPQRTLGNTSCCGSPAPPRRGRELAGPRYLRRPPLPLLGAALAPPGPRPGALAPRRWSALHLLPPRRSPPSPCREDAGRQRAPVRPHAAAARGLTGHARPAHGAVGRTPSEGDRLHCGLQL